MKNHLACLTAFGLLALALPRNADAEPRAVSPAQLETLGRSLDEAARLFQLPGYAAAIVQDGRIVWRRNYGYADVSAKRPIADDSIFSLASITKSFSGVMMMQLEQEGTVALDAPLLDYPFDLKTSSPELLDPNTTVRQVLSMTSGGAAGATYSYNGGRFNLLSGVFEKVAGEPLPAGYARQVTARILAPLHMEQSFDGYGAAPDALKPRIVKRYRVGRGPDGATYADVPYTPSAAYPAPAAGLFSTVDDLARYATALDRNTLVPAARYQEMTTPTRLSGGGVAPYGLGWLTEA